MSKIKYVCLSDMHLGAENSLLTKLTDDCSDTEPTKPSPALVQLVECLRSLIKPNGDDKPTLVLNGDILELALTTDNLAAMAFERFIELILPADESRRLFREIIYIPGNHDHHLWETARETQYVNYISTDPGQQPGKRLDVPWHTTKIFGSKLVPATFLNGIIHRYPHLADKDGSIHHQHSLSKLWNHQPGLGALHNFQSRPLYRVHVHVDEPTQGVNVSRRETGELYLCNRG